MAVDVYSENFAGMISPRLSFSRDLDEDETSTANPINDYSCKLDHTLVDSAFDFAFNVDTALVFPSSSADELFSDGKILPTCLRREEGGGEVVLLDKSVRPSPLLDLRRSTAVTDSRKKSLKEFLEDSIEEEEPSSAAAATAAAKPFWKFRRSNSLNCDRNQRKGLIGSWKILSRSGSTGKFLEKIVEEEKINSYNVQSKFFRKFSRNSSLNSDNSGNVRSNNRLNGSSSKILRRSHSTRDHYFTKSNSSLFRRSNSTGSAPNKLKKQQSIKQQQQLVGNAKLGQKGKEKDNYYNCRSYSYGNNSSNNNYRVNPVLNLPSPYISRVSVDLLSFGSLFCSNGTKDRKKKK